MLWVVGCFLPGTSPALERTPPAIGTFGVVRRGVQVLILNRHSVLYSHQYDFSPCNSQVEVAVRVLTLLQYGGTLEGTNGGGGGDGGQGVEEPRARSNHNNYNYNYNNNSRSSNKNANSNTANNVNFNDNNSNNHSKNNNDNNFNHYNHKFNNTTTTSTTTTSTTTTSTTNTSTNSNNHDNTATQRLSERVIHTTPLDVWFELVPQLICRLDNAVPTTHTTTRREEVHVLTELLRRYVPPPLLLP